MKKKSGFWNKLAVLVSVVVITVLSAVPVLAADMKFGKISATPNLSAQSVEEASQNFPDGLGFVFAYNAAGEVVAYSPAVMGYYGDDTCIFASLAEFSDNSIQSFEVMTSRKEMKAVEVTLYDETVQTVQFQLAEGETMDDSFVELAPTSENADATIYYLRTDKQGYAVADGFNVTVLGINTENDYAHYFVDGLPDVFDGFLPAEMVDSQGRLLAVIDPLGSIIALYPDTSGFSTSAYGSEGTEYPEPDEGPLEDQEPQTPQTESGNSKAETISLIGSIVKLIGALALLAALLVIIMRNSKKKKAEKEAAEKQEQPSAAPKAQGGQGVFTMEDVPSGSGFENMPGTTPQPSGDADMPRTMPQPSGVEDMPRTMPQPEVMAAEAEIPRTMPVEDIGATMPVIPETQFVTPAEEPKPKLVKVIKAVSGPLEGREFTIEEGSELRIGRDPGAEAVFPASTQGVSRLHCKLYFSDGELVLEDTGSSFGTWIPGSGRLNVNEGVTVKESDSFYLGQEENSFVIQ